MSLRRGKDRRKDDKENESSSTITTIVRIFLTYSYRMNGEITLPIFLQFDVVSLLLLREESKQRTDTDSQHEKEVWYREKKQLRLSQLMKETTWWPR